MVRLPVAFKTSEHWPVATAALQVSPPPLTVTLTLPVGVPAPGLFTVTVHCTVTDCPGVDGSGLSDVIVVVVSALFTVCGVAGEEALPLLLVSPAYVAVRLLAPADVNVTSHCPAETAAVHWLVPSLTVTLPVSGVPREPGALTATFHVTVTGCPTTDAVPRATAFVIVVVVLALPTVTVLFAGELLPSLLSTTTLLGSTCAVPPPVRGF